MEKRTKEKTEAINFLESATTFPKLAIYFQIMRYIVAEEQAGNTVKSSTIAFDLSNKNDKTEKINDAYIRSQVFRLRKELDLFYLKEGKDSEHQIFIPKGQYAIKLKTSTREVKKRLSRIRKSPKINWKTSTLVAIPSLLCVCMFFYIVNIQQKTPKYSSFVSLFIGQKNDFDILLGDRYFYQEYDTTLQRKRLIFDTDVSLPHTRINFQKLAEDYPEREIKLALNFTHTDTDNTVIAAQLSKELAQNQLDGDILFSSELKTIKRNTVFISKTNSGDLYEMLTSYFFNSICDFSHSQIYKGHITSFNLKDTTISSKTSSQIISGKRHVISYCLIKKVITTQNKTILFLLPSNDGARKYITKRLFDVDFQTELLQALGGSVPQEFELLLKMNGLSYMNAQAYKIIYSSEHQQN